MMSLDVLLTVYLVRDLHQPAWLSGVLFTASTAVVAIGQTVVSRALQPLPPARVLQLAAAIWAASFLLLWALGAAPQPAVIPGTFAAVAVFTAAGMIKGPTLNALVIAAAPEVQRGRYLAVYQLSWALGRAAAPSLLIWLFAVSPAWPWLTLAATCAAIVVAFSRLGHWIQPAGLSQSRPAGSQPSMTIGDDAGFGPERRWLRRLRGNRPGRPASS
jgi:MFS family permease